MPVELYPFVSRTRQLWKFTLLGIWSAGLLWYFLQAFARPLEDGAELIEEIVGVAVGVLGLVLIAGSIVCPRCRRRLFVHTLTLIARSSHEPEPMKTCPSCGYEPS